MTISHQFISYNSVSNLYRYHF